MIIRYEGSAYWVLSARKVRLLTLRFHHRVHWFPLSSCRYWSIPIYIWPEWTVLLYLFYFFLSLYLISLLHLFSCWFCELFPSLFSTYLFWSLINLRLESVLLLKSLVCLFYKCSWTLRILAYVETLSHFMPYSCFEVFCVWCNLCDWRFSTSRLFIQILFHCLSSWFRWWSWFFTARTIRTLCIYLSWVFKASELILHFFFVLWMLFVCLIIIYILKLPLNLHLDHIYFILVYLLSIWQRLRGSLVKKLISCLRRTQHVVFLLIESFWVCEFSLINLIRFSHESTVIFCWIEGARLVRWTNCLLWIAVWSYLSHALKFIVTPLFKHFLNHITFLKIWTQHTVRNWCLSRYKLILNRMLCCWIARKLSKIICAIWRSKLVISWLSPWIDTSEIRFWVLCGGRILDLLIVILFVVIIQIFFVW